MTATATATATLNAALDAARRVPAPEGPFALNAETLKGLGIRQAINEALSLAVSMRMLEKAREAASNADGSVDPYYAAGAAKGLEALMPYINDPWWVLWADEVLRLETEALDRNWSLPDYLDVYDWLPGERDRVPAWLSEPFEAGRIRNGLDAYLIAARHIRYKRAAFNERVAYEREAALPPMKGADAGDAMLGRRG